MINRITPGTFDTKYHLTTFEHKSAEQVKKDNYVDPLMKWPVRGLAYSSELAVSLNEFSPFLGKALWIPTIAYLGADIYDKYKNDKTSYDPSSIRLTEQAIFQGVASVILPTTVIHMGKDLASATGKAGKSGLSMNAQMELHKILLDYSDKKDNKLSNNVERVDEYKTRFKEFLDNKLNENQELKGMRDKKRNERKPKALIKADREKVHSFAQKQIDEMFELRKILITEKCPPKVARGKYNQFLIDKIEFGKDKFLKDNPIGHAAKKVIRSVQNAKINRLKFAKMLGGFALLGATIKPIDHWTEEFLIRKFVAPTLKQFENNDVQDYKKRIIG